MPYLNYTGIHSGMPLPPYLVPRLPTSFSGIYPGEQLSPVHACLYLSEYCLYLSPPKQRTLPCHIQPFHTDRSILTLQAWNRRHILYTSPVPSENFIIHRSHFQSLDLTHIPFCIPPCSYLSSEPLQVLSLSPPISFSSQTEKYILSGITSGLNYQVYRKFSLRLHRVITLS